MHDIPHTLPTPIPENPDKSWERKKEKCHQLEWREHSEWEQIKVCYEVENENDNKEKRRRNFVYS